MIVIVLPALSGIPTDIKCNKCGKSNLIKHESIESDTYLCPNCGDKYRVKLGYIPESDQEKERK